MIKILLFTIIVFIIGYFVGNINNTKAVKKHIKTKLKDLIDHNLALEKGYPFMENVRINRGKEPDISPKEQQKEKHVKSKYAQQEGKIIFSSGLLRDFLNEKEFVDKEWKRYGMEMYNEDYVKKVKLDD